ncbi:unnamed protein product [Lathyrus sativus]|nr:unnamed protein product [Lathyrus sativus]
MELEHPTTTFHNSAMTFNEVSMERSKSFVNSLQELKNLRPQLYSAAEYCEKSYLLSEQKQMVLDNLKDYAVRALVNAVDHLRTVAYKLTDLLEQHTLDVSTMDLKVSTINQKLLTCQVYTDKEGLRQQQFSQPIQQFPLRVGQQLPIQPQIMQMPIARPNMQTPQCHFLHRLCLHHPLMVKRHKLILILLANTNLFPKSKLPLVLCPRTLLLVQLLRATASNLQLQLSYLRLQTSNHTLPTLAPLIGSSMRPLLEEFFLQ